MKKFVSDGESATEAFAAQFAKTLNNGDVVLLEGELGAGKTAFTKGIARGLGIEEEVVSPTYAYLNVYADRLYHYDCYRLSCGEDALALGLTDYFGGDNIADVLPKDCKKVKIEKRGENEREITIV